VAASLARATAGTHAAYLAATGIWPLVHRSSFERVAGRKHDFWLVRTVGGLAAAIGLSLGLAALRGSRRAETVALAVGSGLAFGAADVRASRTESRAYLGDLALQAAFVASWLRPWDARTVGVSRRRAPAATRP
jgi:hypothetical protein